MTKPTSVVERPISAEDKRIAAEYEAIRRAVGELLLAWANVENQLVKILAAVINNRTYEIASAIYFAPFGIDARLKIVSDAFAALAKTTPFQATLLIEWRTESNCVGHLKRVRNKAAHGELILHTNLKGKGFPRLTWPIFSLSEDETATVLAGQLPGMGANELRQSQQAVEQSAKRLAAFATYAQLIRRGDFATLQKKLAAVIAQNPNRHDPNSQTRAEQPPPPPPCPE